MASRWWQLPGPARFVETVVDAWARGRHVVLWLPRGIYPGVRQACRNEFERSHSAHWAVSVQLEDPHVAPLEILRRELGTGNAVNTSGLTEVLANSTASGGVVWIDGMCSEAWPRWRRMLADLEAATRGLDPLQRTIFGVSVEGLPVDDRPTPDVCLEVMTWDRTVDSIDALIFAASLCQSRKDSDDARMLRSLTIAHLALWDGRIAEALADLTNEELCQPADRLREFAADLGWHPDRGGPGWQDGSAGVWHGRHISHSAWLAVCGESSELKRRHWKAHTQALLPYVEEQRAALLERVRGYLTIPYQPATGDRIDRVEDLEIGHIHAQLGNNSFVNHRLRERIRVLRNIRNALSHLEPVEPALLFHKALEGDFDRR